MGGPDDDAAGSAVEEWGDMGGPDDDAAGSAVEEWGDMGIVQPS